MTDAVLPITVESRGVEEAEKRLDGLTASAVRAEKATDALAGGSKRATSALRDMAEQVVEENRRLETMAREANAASAAAANLAKSAGQVSSAFSHVGGASGTFAPLNKALVESERNVRALRYTSLNLGQQFADVGVSLASGISPLTTLIQQGPQIAGVLAEASARGISLSSVFRSMGAALASLLPALAIAGPILAVVAAVGALGVAMLQGQKEMAQYKNALRVTGNAAGVLSSELQKMSEDVAKSTDTGLGKARETVLALAATGKVAGDEIGRIAEIAVRIQDYTGQNATAVAAQFANMGENVSAFAMKFNEQYHVLSSAQLEHIRLLQEEGRMAEAQSELIIAAQRKLAERGEADLGILERAWRKVANAVGDVWENMKKVGAEGDTGIQNRINAITKEIAINEERDQKYGVNPIVQGRLDFLRKEREGLQGVLDAHKATAKAQAEAAAVTDAGARAQANLNGKWSAGVDSVSSYNRALQAYQKDLDAVAKAGLALPSATEQAAQREAIRKREMPQTYRAENRQGPHDRSDQFLDAAIKNELAARTALVKDVEEVARLKAEAVDNERIALRHNIETAVTEGRVARLVADKALAANDNAAAAKRELVQRELSVQLLQGELQSRRAYNSDLDRMAGYAADTAATLSERQAIETTSLRRRQQLEAYALAASNEQRVATGEISALSAAEVELRRRNVDFMEQEAVARKQQMDQIRKTLDLKQSSLQNSIAIAESEMALATSAGERREIEARINKARKELAIASLEAAIQMTTDTEAQEALRKEIEAVQTAYNNHEKALRKASVTFYDVSDALTQAFRGFKENDLLGASLALFDAIKTTIKVLKDKGASFEGKVGAVAGLASAAGQAIGGRTGSVISGAASGAAAGAAFGPWGAAIGGVLGGVMPLFEKSAKKIREQAEELARVQKAHSEALENANTKRELEIQLLDLQGDKAGSLAKARQAEVLGMDAANVALQNQIWALQDAKEAYESRISLDIRLMTASGNAAGALALNRKKEIDAASEANKAYLAQIQAVEDAADKLDKARSDLQNAYDKEAAALTDLKERAMGVVSTLRDFGLTLVELTNTGQAGYNTLRARFQSTAAGSLTSLDTADKLPDAVTSFLNSSASNSQSSVDYQRDVAMARNAVKAAEDAAQGQATIAEQQLAALDASVSGILVVNQSVLSVRDALNAFAAAMGVYTAANDNATKTGNTTPPVSTTPAVTVRASDWSSYLSHYADVAAEYSHLSKNFLKTIGVTTATEFAKWHYEHYGQSEGRTPYAMGGVFTNGIVSQPTSFHNSEMGENGPEAIVPLIRTPGGLGVRTSGGDPGLADAVAKLADEVFALRADMRASQTAIAFNTAKTAKQLDRWDGEGLPPEREVA